MQDPHRIEARPSLNRARARSADLMVCTGAELEIGWLPLLLTQAGNGTFRPGNPACSKRRGSSFCSKCRHGSIVRRATCTPQGNPHVHLDPRNIAKVAAALAERMAALDPGEAAQYRARAKDFLDRWQQAIARWEKQGAPLKGMPLVVHHKNLTYLINWLGMREVAALEPKPGLPPTTGHLTELLAKLASDPAKAVVRAAYNDPRPGEWLAERAKIPLVTVPFTVGGSDKAKDLFGLFDDTLARLLAVAK